ncbi:MAG: trypsin-like serine protease [Luteolibacter sp.]
MKNPVLALLVFLFLGHEAGAVLVATPSPTNPRTSAPANGAPWDNVILTNGGSGVYLGDGWVLTAEHVFDDQAQPYVTYNSTQYLADLSQSYVLSNPQAMQDAGYTASSDLVLFKLFAPLPGLTTVSLGTPAPNQQITMIGFGGGKSWGTNTTESNYGVVSVSGNNDFIGFLTDYDTATPTEGQGTGGDSGGGAFALFGNEWKLVGLMHAVSTTANPNLTLYSDISVYAPEIASIMQPSTAVPEPSLGMTALSMILLAAYRRR